MNAREYLKESNMNRFIFDPRHRESIISIMQDFATLKCKEQKEICADEYASAIIGFDERIDREYKIIKNAPLPKI